MIEVMPGVSIPEDELHFDASRSGGPGGQNVNKVSTRVTLTFDVLHSSALPSEQRRRILARLRTRINKDGLLRVVSQRTRSQELNREDVTARFAELSAAALTKQRPRMKTKVPS